MAERRREAPDQTTVMQNNQDVIRDITSTIRGVGTGPGAPPIAGSAMRISPELAQRLRDPSQQQELLRQLRVANPEYNFTGLNILTPEQAGDGNFHLQVSMSRTAKVSNSEVISDVRTSLDAFGSRFGGTTMPVTPALFRSLRTEENQQAFIREFEAANPGYTCSFTGFITPFQTKDGLHHIRLSVERSRTSDSVTTSPDVVDDVGTFIRGNSGNVVLSGTSMVISPELAQTLQDPSAQTRLILALQRDYPHTNSA